MWLGDMRLWRRVGFLTDNDVGVGHSPETNHCQLAKSFAPGPCTRIQRLDQVKCQALEVWNNNGTSSTVNSSQGGMHSVYPLENLLVDFQRRLAVYPAILSSLDSPNAKLPTPVSLASGRV